MSKKTQLIIVAGFFAAGIFSIAAAWAAHKGYNAHIAGAAVGILAGSYALRKIYLIVKRTRDNEF